MSNKLKALCSFFFVFVFIFYFQLMSCKENAQKEKDVQTEGKDRGEINLSISEEAIKATNSILDFSVTNSFIISYVFTLMLLYKEGDPCINENLNKVRFLNCFGSFQGSMTVSVAEKEEIFYVDSLTFSFEGTKIFELKGKFSIIVGSGFLVYEMYAKGFSSDIEVKNAFLRFSEDLKKVSISYGENSLFSQKSVLDSVEIKMKKLTISFPPPSEDIFTFDIIGYDIYVDDCSRVKEIKGEGIKISLGDFFSMKTSCPIEGKIEIDGEEINFSKSYGNIECSKLPETNACYVPF